MRDFACRGLAGGGPKLRFPGACRSPAPRASRRFARDLGILAKRIANIQHLYSNEYNNNDRSRENDSGRTEQKADCHDAKEHDGWRDEHQALWISGVNKLPSI